MKTWLFVSFVLFSFDLIDAKHSISDDGKDEIVKNVNDLRRKYAKEKSIPNMWELEWSDELEEKIDNDLPKNCASLVAGSDYRFTFDSSGKEVLEWLERETKYLKDGNLSWAQKYTGYNMEATNPKQKSFACGKYSCPYVKSQDPYYTGQVYEFKIICLFGPEGTLEINPSEGEAGSKCEDEDGEDDDGLCVNESSTIFNFSILVSLVFLSFLIFD